MSVPKKAKVVDAVSSAAIQSGIQDHARAKKKRKEKEEEEEYDDDYDQGYENDEDLESHSLGTKLHDGSQSVSDFDQEITKHWRSVELEPLADIFDGGNLNAPLFRQKWTLLLRHLSAAQLSHILLELVDQESLVLAKEFDRHVGMLCILLAAINESKTLMQAIMIAKSLRSDKVLSQVLWRLSQLEPMEAHQLMREYAFPIPLLFSRRMQDKLDREEDERLAAVEESPNSDDEDFIVNDDDQEDGDYESSESTNSDCDNGE